jgi:hypothetical protein
MINETTKGNLKQAGTYARLYKEDDTHKYIKFGQS